MKAKTLLAALAMTLGVVALGAQPALAAGCGGSYKSTSWGYDWARYLEYVSVCDHMQAKGEYSHPIYGYLWTDWAYDYTVGDAYGDYDAVKTMPPCCRPATNATGYSTA